VPDESLHDLAWLSAYLGIPAKTLYNWRLTGKGPPAYKLGQHLRWTRADVDAWLAEQRK
jgi:excisionase family DNA binding protein